MNEFENYREKRNVIDNVQHTSLSKKELIELIRKTFPDEEVGYHGQVAQITTTTMTDGTKNAICLFRKDF